jgi:arylsulfatase A-like enzyme
MRLVASSRATRREAANALRIDPDQVTGACQLMTERVSRMDIEPRFFQRALGLGLSFVLLACSVAGAAPPPGVKKPNLLIIFTDDQGYGDIGCYGNQKNKTPRLDLLAEQGTRFTSFYAQTVCGPSRSALLTGRHPIRSRGWGMPASEVTFAELIRGSGYQTACIGKWDVSNRKTILDRMPNAQGFDYYFGTLGANDGGRVTFHENNEPAGSTGDMGSLTTLYTNKAIAFLQERRDPRKPFVLYLAHTMMHTIIDASASFRGKSDGGLYGDVVEEFDYETGRLLDVLEDLGLSEETLVIYTSDNGPWNQDKYTKEKKGHPQGSVFWGDSGRLRNGKGSCYEGGYRLPCIVRWPGQVPAGRVSDAIFGTIDFMPTFASLASFDLPADRRIDGIDQTDLLLGKRESGRDHFYYHDAGVRQGRWKYLKAQAFFHNYAVEDDRQKAEELYDLHTDVGEQVNRAAEFPEKVAELKALMRSIEGDRKPEMRMNIR